PMHQYLLQVRMAVALDRLSAGATDLSRLALDLGFATHSHFSAAFRQYFDVAPRVARAALENVNARHRIACDIRNAAPCRGPSVSSRRNSYLERLPRGSSITV